MEIKNPFPPGLSEDEMWEEYRRTDRLRMKQEKRHEMLLNSDIFDERFERSFCESMRLHNLCSDMYIYLSHLIWGDYKPMNLPKTEDEFLAQMQAMSQEERDIFYLCDFSSHFKAAEKCLESCNKTWSFENDFNKLKNYKTIHGWDNAFIERTFGVNFKQAKNLYYRLQRKP